MNFAVVVFPGSNSDYDAFHAASAVLGERASLVWHKDTSLGDADAVILPGGFAHGDYLRTGAIARFSPIMPAVARFAERGGPVLGICNGFQVLLEAGLLPGAMVRNRGIKFVSRLVTVRVEATDTPFTHACAAGQVLRLPIAHGEGNYFADPEAAGLARGEPSGGVPLRRRRRRSVRDRQPQRVGPQHRRHLQCGPQRRRPHAPPGTRLGTVDGQRRWPRRARVGGEGLCRRYRRRTDRDLVQAARA